MAIEWLWLCTKSNSKVILYYSRFQEYTYQLSHLRCESHAYKSKGAFFWDYSGIGILGMDSIRILLGAFHFWNEQNIIPFIMNGTSFHSFWS